MDDATDARNARWFYDRLCRVLPGFDDFFQAPQRDNPYFFQISGIQTNFVLGWAAYFVAENRLQIADDDYRRLATLLNQCLAAADHERATAVRQCFLNTPSLWPLASAFEQSLSAEALCIVRDAFDQDLKRRSFDMPRTRFELACLKAGARLREKRIDRLMIRPYIRDENEARLARLWAQASQSSESIVLARVAKPFFKSQLPQFKWLRDRDCRLQLEKPLAGELKTLLYISKEPAYQVGKLFFVELGVSAESGPYRGAYLVKEIAEIMGMPPNRHCWQYTTRADLEIALEHVAAVVKAVLPIFEQAIREDML